MFHTQEKREKRLSAPVKCIKENAWMGVAWYFWYDSEEAFFWGLNSKRRTGYFEIYSADIDCENVLDTVFNEDHYQFWKKQIEKAQTAFIKSGINPTLKILNDYFLDKKIWASISGIMFQDISNREGYYITEGFQYKKRVQLAVYKSEIIANFALHNEGQCV